MFSDNSEPSYQRQSRIYTNRQNYAYPYGGYNNGYSSGSYYPGYGSNYYYPGSYGNVLNFGIASALNVLGIGISSGLGISVG